MDDGDTSVWGWVVIVVIGLILLLAVFIAWPIYNVWSSQKHGEAALAQATYDRQVAVVEAEAKNASAAYEAEAEVTRAHGVAKANQIIGTSLKNNEDYLRYLWVNNLENSKNQVIYVPTEAGMPLLEASRLNNPAPTQGGA